ncbi:hypothetical protein [Gordonia polyisoprenivorans]|uniref:hypothetical protein n=1 Tax=Gordonia polyisoprenivorans TaxID=84595 RepID=UPI0005BB8B96|nr:hypothetical protein [Gordonia polyisoprenivorans]
MRRTVVLALTCAAGAGGLVAGTGAAAAALPDGAYRLCVQTQYGSSVEQRCGDYTVEGDKLIGTAGTLDLVSTPSGAYADIPPVSRITFVKTGSGYKAINSVLGVPVATSTFTPVTD